VIGALLGYEPSRALGIDLAETLFFDEPAPATLRVQMVRELARYRRLEEPCGTRIQELLTKAARADGSVWVRETAREAIRSE